MSDVMIFFLGLAGGILTSFALIYKEMYKTYVKGYEKGEEHVQKVLKGYTAGHKDGMRKCTDTVIDICNGKEV